MTTKKKKLDALAAAVKGIPAGRIEEYMSRKMTLNMRLSQVEKEGIKAAATRYGLTVTEYLLRLHALVSERAATAKKKSGRQGVIDLYNESVAKSRRPAR